MNPLLSMILSSLFNGMGGGFRNPMMPNQNGGSGPNQMGGNPLLNMLMGGMGGGMNPMNGNPLMNMLMGNMGGF